jgi:hypothetical protein
MAVRRSPSGWRLALTLMKGAAAGALLATVIVRLF